MVLTSLRLKILLELHEENNKAIPRRIKFPILSLELCICTDLNPIVMIKKYLLSWAFIGLLIPLLGQDELANIYRSTAEQVNILSNNDLLPLQRLDTLRVAVITPEGYDFSTFLKTLHAYIEVDQIEVSEEKTTENIVADINLLYNFTILALPTSELAKKSQKIKNVIRHSRSQNSVLAIFRDPDFEGQAWTALPPIGASIEAPLSTWGQSLAAQTIFGGFDKTGLMPSQKRLGFAPAQALEVDGQLLEDSIQAIIQEGLDQQAFPGAQVLVAYKGNIIYHQAFGYHTYDKKKAVQLDDIYDLASVTKVSSSLPYLMKRHGQGRFDLEASLADYFPALKRSNKGDLSFRQMLAHNARLRPWIPYWKGTLKKHPKYPWNKKWDNERINDFQFRKKTFSRDSSADYNIYVADDLWQHRDYQEKMMKAIKKSPLNEEPGYVYSGLLFYLLPDYVARTSGKSYEAALDYYFYQPLGATTLGFNPLREFPKERIIPTERDTFFRMTQIHGNVHDEGAAMMGGLSSNAGLFSSANDLAKLFQMYLNGGEYGGERYIAAESVKEFTRCQYCDDNNRRGLGFDKPLIDYNKASSSVAEAASAASFGHSGYTGTFAWADPEAELLFIFMSNRVYPTRLNRKLYTLGIRPRIHTAIYEAIKSKK